MAAKKHQRTLPKPAPSAPDPLQILDLTGAADRRPLVKFDSGEYRMLLVEELTFGQFSEQADIGRKLVEIGTNVGEPGAMDELQDLVVKGVQMILVDMDDEAAHLVTPGQYLRIAAFFNSLDAADVATSSATGSSDAPDVNGSSGQLEAP